MLGWCSTKFVGIISKSQLSSSLNLFLFISKAIEELKRIPFLILVSGGACGVVEGRDTLVAEDPGDGWAFI